MMLKEYTIKLSNSVQILQTFELDSDGAVISEYHSIQLIHDGDKVTQVINFVGEEFAEEALKTAGTELLTNRLTITS